MDSIVDDIDIAIINILEKEARASFADIARRLTLSPSAIRERVQRLEDHGVIRQYQIALDYKQLGYDIEAFILVKVFHGKLQSFLRVIKTYKEVKDAYRITGNYNVHLKVILKDRMHLQDFIDRIMVYGDTHTSLILSDI
ncbi:Lrp/AsnC family transcriptional regulator [Aquimarina sp. TRL1]|uniref:Lrp/AsnC family transcriptional regulator n=1 Tax=Aquimarina sp. (strain TRL1) TaxID=2736252 RepID=UPI0020CB5961|nr:Lrp/AsnC family transcriptional regulator [Aquimarina sp. TRL1]